MNKIGDKLLLGVAGLVVLGLGIYLFFGDQILFYLQSETDIFERPAARSETDVIKVGYAFSHQQHDPVYFDPVTRSHLVDIYEGLVKTDNNLNIKPAVAISWGIIDPYTWEFILRRNVKFHNGELVTPEDVKASIDRARTIERSQIKPLLNSIEEVKVLDDERVHIITDEPDPLLLQKMAVTLIHPASMNDFHHPVGTGPYKMTDHTSTIMALSAFEDYWGVKPVFKNAEIITIEDRRTRIEALEQGQIDFLLNFPPNVGCSFFDAYKELEGCKVLNSDNVIVESVPGLEVSFLAFNMQHTLLGQKEVRSAISKSFDHEVFKEIAFGFANPANQFVASGVFGYSPEISKREYDLEAAKKEIAEVIGSTFDVITVRFDYPETLPPIGQYVQAQMRELGIEVQLNPISDFELQDLIIKGESDFYYLGWRSELGDASDFLQAVAHSKDLESGYGLFNGMKYENREVDELIEGAQKNMDTKARARQMQEAMKIIVEEDIVGVPLFESEVLYAFSNNIQFNPRIDGYVSVASIK